MYKNKKVSVVMPAYNEEEAIVQVINDFNKDFVDEIIVCDNNSVDGTARLAKQAGAKVVGEKRQGQGYAIMTALKAATGDLVFLTESDTTFLGKDMLKLLQYIDDADIVIGSRVNKPMIGPKAMNWWTRWGNWFLSVVLQIRYGNRYSFDDVGVTFRLFRKSALDKIKSHLTVGGPDSIVEMTILACKKKMRILQIPTWYTSRRGLSKQSFTIFSSIKIGWKHFLHILFR